MIIVILISLLVLLIIIKYIRLKYDLVLDEIYDNDGQRLLIVWYNDSTTDDREYKILMKL